MRTSVRDKAANQLRSAADTVAAELTTPQAVREHLQVTHGYPEFILDDGTDAYCTRCDKRFASGDVTSTCTDGSFHIFETHDEAHTDPESIRHPHRH